MQGCILVISLSTNLQGTVTNTESYMNTHVLDIWDNKTLATYFAQVLLMCILMTISLSAHLCRSQVHHVLCVYPDTIDGWLWILCRVPKIKARSILIIRLSSIRVNLNCLETFMPMYGVSTSSSPTLSKSLDSAETSVSASAYRHNSSPTHIFALKVI